MEKSPAIPNDKSLINAGNNKGQTTVSDARIGARAACEIDEANDYNESHC
jgi:hypothetical protein